MSGNDGDVIAVEGPGPPWRTIMLAVIGLLGAIVLGALVMTLGEANRQRDRALQLQSHSYEVMILARVLAGTIAKAEASLGRYVISGDKALGTLYFDDWKLAGQQINRLELVTSDNRSHQQRLARLRGAYNARGDELALIALSTSYRKNDQALARYYQAREATSLRDINTLLDGIITRERTLLDVRSNDALRSVEQSNQLARVLGVFGLLIVLGAIALGWLTVQALGQRASARAEAEAERERAHELEMAVNKATAELRAQESKLRQVQKMEAVGQLTGGIAHDFNNMLAVVLGGLELARRNITTDPALAARQLDNAMEGANRAAALTRRLLAFSREEALKVEPIDPAGLIATMSDLLDRTLGDAITVVTRDTAKGWMLAADRYQLENVILNLAVNARDAMDGRGTLTIATDATTLAEHAVGTCAAGDYTMIAVSDTGCGMAADVVERVFEPFFTTKPVGQGTGLGLSQIFAFVRQANGEIGIRSAPGQGTTVTLYLPRHCGTDIAAIVTEQAVPAPTTPRALDILVVEDDPRVLTATIGALEELGHRPIACNDPLAAPGMLAAAGQVDLILSDVLMPGQTGPEMIAGLARDYGHIAVLYVTGFAGDAGGEAQFGGHHVLRKPFTIAALQQSIASAMEVDRPGAAHRPADTTPDSIAAE